MKKTAVKTIAMICLGFAAWTGCSSESAETGSDYVIPEDESPEEEGPIDGDES